MTAFIQTTWDYASLRRVRMVYASLSRLIWPQSPLTALLTLYSTTAGFPFSTTKWPAPRKTPVSRSFSFSSPVSNLISMTRVVIRSRSRDWKEKDRHNSNGAKQEKRQDLGGSSANTYTNCQTPSSSRPGSRSTTISAQESYLQRRCKRGTLDHRSYLWDTSATELISLQPLFWRESFGHLLDYRMCVQPHVFAARIVMDIIRTLADQSGINGWGKTGLGLDGTTRHCLKLLGVA